MKRSKDQYVEIKLETGLKGRGKICLKIITGKYNVTIRKGSWTYPLCVGTLVGGDRKMRVTGGAQEPPPKKSKEIRSNLKNF